MESKLILASVMADLKEKNLMPKRIDLSKIGERYWCVVSDYDADFFSVINEDVTTGFSNEKETAVLKALSERAERKAFIQGFRYNLSACQTERSDGFAAMPSCIDRNVVRQNALNEAIERYVWAYWWDHIEIAYEKTEVDWDSQVIQNSAYLKEAFLKLDLEKIFIIEPRVFKTEKAVVILFAQVRDRGFISGGASSLRSNGQEIFLRAFDELFRHGFAYGRSFEKNIHAKSFYEKRLQFFASGLGNFIVEDRLNIAGTKEIVLPDLKIDSEVPSLLQGFNVHRCYFENQPPFVGGNLERLCL